MAKIMDIEINKVQIEDNIRTKGRDTDLVELMESIKQYGLLHPIGVKKNKTGYQYIWGYRRLKACEKLGRKTITAYVSDETEDYSETDVKILNVVENLQRKDITPLELGRICQDLKHIGMSDGEIGARLSITQKRVSEAIALYNMGIPEQLRKDVQYFAVGHSQKKGKIPASLATYVGTLVKRGLNKQDAERLLLLVKQEELSYIQLVHLGKLLQAKMSFDEAVRKLDRWDTARVDLIVDKELKRQLLKEYRLPFQEIIRRIITGKIPLQNKLFYTPK